jgi:hypothetical protein
MVGPVDWGLIIGLIWIVVIVLTAVWMWQATR